MPSSRQLAHGERDAVRVAATYPEPLPVRRRMIPGVGGLFEEAQEWIERRGARKASGGLRAEICLTLCEYCCRQLRLARAILRAPA
jgi:hypothetical protein